LARQDTIGAIFMVTGSLDATLLLGRVPNPERARDALAALTTTPPGGEQPDVIVYSASNEHLILASVNGASEEAWASDVLRSHGATVQQHSLVRWITELRNRVVHASGGTRGDAGTAIALVYLLIERGLLQRQDILEFAIASAAVRSGATAESGDEDELSPTERRRRLAEAERELRDVIRRLEAELRSRSPELFDARGRLRRKALSERLIARAGGKTWLSGDELIALEEAADVGTTRSANAS
jgi:hypothetical protein